MSGDKEDDLAWVFNPDCDEARAVPTVPNTNTETPVEEWLAIRKRAGLEIDPETAEVHWEYGEVGDPYGVHPLPDWPECVGRNYFARSPGRDEWVSFDDLPDAVRDALFEKHESRLRFPAGWES